MDCCLLLVPASQLGVNLFLKQYKLFWFQPRKLNGSLSFKVAHFSASGLGRDKTSRAAEYNGLFFYFRCDWAPGVASVLDPTPTLKWELCYHFPTQQRINE